MKNLLFLTDCLISLASCVRGFPGADTPDEGTGEAIKNREGTVWFTRDNHAPNKV